MKTEYDPTGHFNQPIPHLREMAGLIPMWMDAIGEAAEGKKGYDIRIPLDKLYRHGGGWSPCSPDFGWELDPETLILVYPCEDEDDEVHHPLIVWRFDNGQVAAFYNYAWTVVQTPEHGFEVVRMD